MSPARLSITTDQVGGIPTIELSQLNDQKRDPRESHCSTYLLPAAATCHMISVIVSVHATHTVL